MSPARFIVVPAALFAVLAIPALAHAQACGDGAACPEGLSCQTTTETVCTAAGCSSEDTACPEPTCVTEPVTACRPIPCDASTTCPTGMVCYANSYEECSQSSAPCAPDGTCADPEPPVCTPVTEPAVCTPAWALPCQVAADCGVGFQCVAQESCMCSGGIAPAPAGEGGAAADPAPAECTCEPTGVMVCEPAAEVACAADADCITGWTCVDVMAGDVACTDVGGSSEAPVCEPATPNPVCVPPYYEAGLYYGTVRSSDEASTGGGTVTLEPTPATTDPNARSTTEAGGGGCQMSPGRAASVSGLLLGLLGLLGLRRRI